VCAAPMGVLPAGRQRPGGDMLASWAEGLGHGRVGVRGRRCLRFAFYGRVSTEDWQERGFPRAGHSPSARQLVRAEPATTSPAIRGARDAQLASLAEPARAYPPIWSAVGPSAWLPQLPPELDILRVDAL